MHTLAGVVAVTGVLAWAVVVVEHRLKKSLVEALVDGLSRSETLHDDAAGNGFALRCNCIGAGFPDGDRRAAMLVGIAGVVGGFVRPGGVLMATMCL